MSITYYCGKTKGCHCDKDGKFCEWPCWQRIGLTSEPCCKDCAPLPKVEK